MNVRHYLLGIATDHGLHRSVDEGQLARLQPGDAVHLVVEGDPLITAKTYLVESIEHGINGSIVLVDVDHNRITVAPRELNVFRTTGYGLKLSRMFTDIEDAKRYIENVSDVLELRTLEQTLSDQALAVKLAKQGRQV